MRCLSIWILILLFDGLRMNAQRPWQAISDPGIKDLVQNFRNPPPEYGMILWWGWDGPVTDTVIMRDLDRIKAMGFRGVMIEAGYGMTAKYLSPEWFTLTAKAVNEAKIRDMKVWIEDEGKYPSGFAGGKFSSERPDLKMQGLVVTDRIDAKPGDNINIKLPYFVLSAAAYNNTNKTTEILDVTSGQLKWVVPDGDWKIFIAGHRFRSSVTRSVNNPSRGKDTTASLMDYLNPAATRQFLVWTHEQYKKAFGDEFGKTFMGFMGDEPDFAYTPWTPKMPEEFRARKGYDIIPYLATFFVPQLSEEIRRMKADYWDVWSDLFRDNFFTVQAEWCSENNIEYIVHLNHEDQLPGLSRSSGDFFKNMRNVGAPGVDAIWSQIWMDHVSDYPKLASSASHLYGKPRAFTESFAAYTYRPSVSQAKWVLDYQMARGINSVQIMFMPASTTVRPQRTSAAARPVTRTSFFQSDTFPPVAQYINRATYLLSQGRPASQIGVYFPTLSMWYGDNESNTFMLDLSRQLTENQLDFDFVDEQALSSVLTQENNLLINLSRQAYKVIIVPQATVISKASLEKLKNFAYSGGKVLFLGKQPSLITGQSFKDAEKTGELSWAKNEQSGKLTQDVFAFLPEPDVKTGQSLPDLKYLHRTLEAGELYFFFNEGKNPVSSVVTLAGRGKVQEWDSRNGQITGLKSSPANKNKTSVQLELDGWETKFIFIRK
jgi:hypothetical protein